MLFYFLKKTEFFSAGTDAKKIKTGVTTNGNADPTQISSTTDQQQANASSYNYSQWGYGVSVRCAFYYWIRNQIINQFYSMIKFVHYTKHYLQR